MANNAIEDEQLKRGVDVSRTVNRFATTAAVVRFSNGSADLLQIADSIILVIYSDGHAELPLTYYDQDLENMRKWRQLADSGKKEIRQLLNDDVVAVRNQANKTYGVLNGDNNVANFILTKNIALTDVSSIVLLSDGMFIPKTDPDADENWQQYAELYQQGGLNAIYDTVRTAENNDPELIKYPRYKLHDDASGVAIDLK